MVSKCIFGHCLLSMLYPFVSHTFICSIYDIFYYIAMIPYAIRVNASLQYANSVIATLPLCQLSTCHENLWWTYNMTVLRLLQNRRAQKKGEYVENIKFSWVSKLNFMFSTFSPLFCCLSARVPGVRKVRKRYIVISVKS